MISYLQGVVLEKKPEGLVLDVGGVGYEVFISLQTLFMLPNIGEKTALYIQTIVREDLIGLYGFKEKIEKGLFQALIKVNGIGPKSALSILSSVTPSMLVTILEQKDIKRLVKLPGIGRKTAERLLIELTDKLSHLFDMDTIGDNGEILGIKENPASRDAIDALVSLGYKPIQADKLIRQIDDGKMTSDSLIREALKQNALV
jgi:Holliday junction DNA helicase RuvA